MAYQAALDGQSVQGLVVVKHTPWEIGSLFLSDREENFQLSLTAWAKAATGYAASFGVKSCTPGVKPLPGPPSTAQLANHRPAALVGAADPLG